MWILYLAIYLLAWGTGCGIALAVLTYALFTFVQTVAPGNEAASLLLCSSIACALPLAALLAGYLLDEYLFRVVQGRVFGIIALPCAGIFFLGDGVLLDYLAASIGALKDPTFASYLTFVLSLVSTVLFCGAIVALCIAGACMALELPLRWLTAASRIEVSVPYDGLRVVLSLLLLSVSSNLLLSMLVRELQPSSLLRVLGG